MLSNSESAPSKIPNAEQITDQLTVIQQRRCHKCGEYLHIIYPPHHALIHNNKSNRKDYPVLIHHPVNLVLLCYPCHSRYGYYMQIQSKITLYRIEEKIIERKPWQDDAYLKQWIYKEYKMFINWCNTEKIVPKRL